MRHVDIDRELTLSWSECEPLDLGSLKVSCASFVSSSSGVLLETERRIKRVMERLDLRRESLAQALDIVTRAIDARGHQ